MVKWYDGGTYLVNGTHLMRPRLLQWRKKRCIRKTQRKEASGYCPGNYGYSIPVGGM